jgi:hypothetical protein
MRLEHVDRRVLAALQFRDAVTQLRITTPLVVQAEGVRLIRNLSDLYVIVAAPGFRQYSAWFAAPPPAPVVPPTTIELTVSDPGRGYLPRRFDVTLPRDIDPQHAANADSIFQPLNVDLFPSPVARVADGWAVIRASVIRAGSNPAQPLPHALIRVIGMRNGVESELGLGLADARGEALVAVPGIAATNWDAAEDGPVVSAEVNVTVEALFDANAGAIPNPDRLNTLWESAPTGSVSAKLAAGREVVITAPVTLS